MKIVRVFENVAPSPAVRITLEELFDMLITKYYSDNKVISTASSNKGDV